eukprot:scaffold2504_cov138-Skeletonema_marinoi.AAC.2
MVSTRVSKRKANERPKRQRRASAKFGAETTTDKPAQQEKNKNTAKKKKKVETPAITSPKKKTEKTTKPAPKKNKKKEQQQPKKAAAPKVAAKAKVKNTPKTAKKKTTEIIEEDNDDESSTEVEQKEVRVKVRLDEKLNKGYRFARLSTSSSSSKKKNVKAQKKPAVAKRSKPTVKQTVAAKGGAAAARDKTIRVNVRVEKDVKVRVRMDKKLMKGDRSALVNDTVMNDDEGEEQQQQLVATQKKKSPKITIRVSKKKEDGSTKNDIDAAKKKKRAKSKEDDNEEGISDTEQQSPPQKKAKISQFGNDIDPKRLCTIDGCDKYKKARCGGHCLLHYEGLSDAGKAEIAKENELKKSKVAPEKKRCKVEGCTKYFKAKHDGFCMTCYREDQDGKKESSDGDGLEKSTTDLPTKEDEGGAPIVSNGMAAESSGPKSAKHCNFEGCMKYKQKGCIGFCLTHKEYADPEQRRLQNEIAAAESAMKKKTNKHSLCKIVGCDKYKQANCNGYCLHHVKAKKAYDDDDLEDVTKVRVRCDTRLQNGFCVAILSDENRSKLGLKRPPPMSDEDEDEDEDGVSDDDDVEMEMGQGEEEAPSAAAKAGQPDFEVSPAIRRKENGALMCKAVGCPKIAQTKDDGFCRTHYNRFKISTGLCESWDCKCGEKIAITSLRCGKCHRWKDGHHPAYASSPQKSPGVASPSAATLQPRTRIPAGVEISDVMLKNERGRPLCKVIGCGKAEQTQNDGFCRTHFNEFAIPTDVTEVDLSEKWTCECGEEWPVRQKRCGNTSCQKWRGGKRESYSYSPSKYSGISEDNIIKDSKWTCDNCGEEVDMRKSRCGSCNRWRGGKRQGGWTLGSASNYDSDDGGIDRSKDWSCDNCNDGEVISASQTRCGKCNRWRGGKRKPAPWECSKCNLSNPGGKRRCAGCLAWKGTTKKVSEPPATTTAAKSVPSVKLPAKVSKKPQAAKAVQPVQQASVTQQTSNQMPTLPNFGTIDLTKLSYVNYDFNQSYYESSDYSYLNGSFTSSYFPGDKESTEEKKDEVEAS